MVKKPEVLAIIPARGGSKGIPRKNIRVFAGFPLLAYSIKAATQSDMVTRVIVSTDDEEIAAVAREYGAETPFMRPAELAEDNTTDLPVFQHALTWLKNHEGYQPDVVIQLRPTSPIRPVNCVDDAVRLLLGHPEADSVRGVVESAQNPYKMWRVDGTSGHMVPLIGIEGVREAYNAPRQNLPLVYWQTGHVDAIRPEVILKKDSMSGAIIKPLIIDTGFTVDIDTPADWILAERMVRDGNLEIVDPAKQRRVFPTHPKLLVMDFDGVLTDNRVWVNENGEEMVATNRGDGLGLGLLREIGSVECLVISKERNPVVEARCKKNNLPVMQAVDDKANALRQVMLDKHLKPDEVIYIGNDINDSPCFDVVGYAVCPSDSHPEVLRRADLILTRPGGFGVVRELCDILIARLQ